MAVFVHAVNCSVGCLSICSLALAVSITNLQITEAVFNNQDCTRSVWQPGYHPSLVGPSTNLRYIRCRERHHLWKTAWCRTSRSKSNLKFSINICRRDVHLRSWPHHGHVAMSSSWPCTCGRHDRPSGWACQYVHLQQPHLMTRGENCYSGGQEHRIT